MAFWVYNNFRIKNVSTGSNIAFCIAIICSILYAAHFTISVLIAYYLYIHEFIYLFGIHLSMILLVFVIGLTIVYILFFDDTTGELLHPTIALQLFLFYITAEQYWYDVTCFVRINRDHKCCKISNIIISVLTLPLFVIFGPLYSISNVLATNKIENENFSFWMNYQIFTIIFATIIPFLIICLSIKSLPFIITIFCMISILLAITYLIIAIFFAFSLVRKPWEHNHWGNKYWNYLPFVIIIEFLSILSMVFIATSMGLWKSNIDNAQNVLLLLCFINTFIPNFPFFKSYLMNKYVNTITNTPQSEYVMEETNSTKRIDKVFCILVFASKKSTEKKQANSLTVNEEKEPTNDPSEAGISMQQTVKQQLKYSKLSKEEKIKFIEDNFDSSNRVNENNGKLKHVLWRIYVCSSLIAFLSPFAWMIPIAVEYELYDLSMFIFLWFILIYYFGAVLGFVVTMRRNKLWISRELMYYGTQFKQIQSKLDGIDMDQVKKYYEQIPMIEIVFDYFQSDIAMIIVLYLLGKVDQEMERRIKEIQEMEF